MRDDEVGFFRTNTLEASYLSVYRGFVLAAKKRVSELLRKRAHVGRKGVTAAMNSHTKASEGLAASHRHYALEETLHILMQLHSSIQYFNLSTLKACLSLRVKEI